MTDEIDRLAGQILDAETTQLRADLAAERKRREEAEARERETGQTRDEVVAAFEKQRRGLKDALAALEEAQQQLAHLRASHKAQCDARERAEADNAALLALIDEAARRAARGSIVDAVASLTRSAHSDHPGAALLERMRVALAYAKTGLRWFHGHHCNMNPGAYPENPRECADAVCREWAHGLEPKP